MNVKILGLLLPLGLVACAQIPAKNDTDDMDKSAKQAEMRLANLPKQELTAPVLFDYLGGKLHCSVVIPKLP